MDKILGLKLIGKNGDVLTNVFANFPYTLLYFSASWCPPCRMFTPKLIDFYQKVNAPKHLVEIALVSRDHSEENHEAYYKPMPWLCVPYEDRALSSELMVKFDVFTIPKLVLINSDGTKLLDTCRDEVESLGADALKNWSKAKYRI